MTGQVGGPVVGVAALCVVEEIFQVPETGGEGGAVVGDLVVYVVKVAGGKAQDGELLHTLAVLAVVGGGRPHEEEDIGARCGLQVRSQGCVDGRGRVQCGAGVALAGGVIACVCVGGECPVALL